MGPTPWDHGVPNIKSFLNAMLNQKGFNHGIRDNVSLEVMNDEVFLKMKECSLFIPTMSFKLINFKTMRQTQSKLRCCARALSDLSLSLMQLCSITNGRAEYKVEPGKPDEKQSASDQLII